MTTSLSRSRNPSAGNGGTAPRRRQRYGAPPASAVRVGAREVGSGPSLRSVDCRCGSPPVPCRHDGRPRGIAHAPRGGMGQEGDASTRGGFARLRDSVLYRVVGTGFLVLLLQIPVGLIAHTIDERRMTR